MRRTKGSSWSVSAGGRRMLLDLHDSSAEHDSSMRTDEYEEPESVFIPNNATTRYAAAAATAAASAPALPAAAAAPEESAPSGLAGLVSYGSDDDESAAPVSAVPAAPASSSATLASAGSPSPSPPLPPGWTACTDAESGDTYWWNENTDETTWDRPTGTMVEDAAAAAAAPAAAASAEALQTNDKHAVAEVPSSTAATAAVASATPSPPPTAVAVSSVNAPPGVVKKAAVAATNAESNEGGVAHAATVAVPAAAAAAALPSATTEVPAAAAQPLEHSPDENTTPHEDDGAEDVDGSPLDPAEVYPLPAGWSEVAIAPESRGGGPAFYFFNDNSGETTWDRPKMSATEIAQFRAARVEQERFMALQARAANEIIAAAARKEREERATFLQPVAGSCSQASLISALTAGLQARLRPYLSKGMAPFASTSIGDSLSPLLRFHAVLESRIQDWTELFAKTPPPPAAVLEYAESQWVSRLTQATVEIDGVLKADEVWRAERTQILATQQYESASLQHQQYLAAQMAAYPTQQPQHPMMSMQQEFTAQRMPMQQHGYAMQQPVQPMAMQRLTPRPPPLPPAPAAVPSAPVSAAAAPAPSSGFVHPSRSAHVIISKPAFTAGVPPPPTNRASGQKRSAGATASGQSAAAADGVPKKKRVDSHDAKQLGRMGELVSKWTAVAAASERAETEALSAAAKWKDRMDANNSNLIPIGDWRARVAAGQANAAEEGSG